MRHKYIFLDLNMLNMLNTQKHNYYGKKRKTIEQWNIVN